MRDGNGQPVFESGGWDAQTGEINGLDMPYEVHHDVITDPDQVQIYQALMQDVDGNVTYTLLRGASYIKDNRLPPEGFTTQGPYYDSTAVAGLATQDPNFNIGNAGEGSGADTVTYRIGNLDPGANYQLEAKLLYQTLAVRFAEDLFQYSTPEVQTFQGYYQQADKSPITIDSLQLTVAPTGISTEPPALPETPLLVRAYPNPFNPTIRFDVEVKYSGKLSIDIYNLLGEKIFTITSKQYSPGRYHFAWDAQSDNGEVVASGVYIVEAVFSASNSSRSFRTSQRIVYLK